MYGLFYWYKNERNWSTQKTATIIRPRVKKGENYSPGQLVWAKFGGGTFKACVVIICETFIFICKETIYWTTAVLMLAGSTLKNSCLTSSIC